jgi:type I restriction enzyme S subunit
MTNLPSGWTQTTLGNIGEYLNGRGFKKSEWRDSGRPIIRIQNLTGSSSSFNHYDGPADERYIARAGDLLVSWAATLGVFVWQGPEAVVNQHIFKVGSRIDPSFHRYLLLATLDALRSQTHGSGMVHITKSRFEETEVLLPPLNEQRRIVGAIEEQFSRLDAADDSLRTAERRLKSLRMAVVADSIRGDWRRAAVGDITDDSRHGLAIGPFGSNLKVSDYRDEGVPLVFVRNIRSAEFRAASTRFISAAKAKELAAHRVRSGDVLVTKMGDPPGDATVYPEGFPDAIITADCIKIAVGDSFDARFVALAINAPEGKRQVLAITKGVAQKKVSLGRFKSIEIPAPPLEEQRLIVARVETSLSIVDEMRGAVDAAARRSAGVRRSILKRAFRGELVPQNPSDEPAAALLDRSRTAGAASPPAPTRRMVKA